MSSHSSVAVSMDSSLMEPPPVASEIRVAMGPKQIRLTTMPSASRMAMPAWERIMNFFALPCDLQAIMAMMAMTSTTPNAARYGATVVNTLMTSSMLIANISVCSSLFLQFFACGARGAAGSRAPARFCPFSIAVFERFVNNFA